MFAILRGERAQHGVRRPGESVNPVHHRRAHLGAPGEGLVQMHRIPVRREPREGGLIVQAEAAAGEWLVGHQWSCNPVMLRRWRHRSVTRSSFACSRSVKRTF